MPRKRTESSILKSIQANKARIETLKAYLELAKQLKSEDKRSG